jgi:hypothetical protein
MQASAGLRPLNLFFPKFDVPVGNIEKMLPTVVIGVPKVDLNERTPFRAFGFADQVHAGLERGPVCLAGITLDAGANDIFPGGGAAAIARDNVVQIEVFSVENFAAILAGVLVPLENVMAGEFHFLLGHAVEEREHNDARHTNFEGDGVNALGMGLFLRKIVPFLEIISLEGTVWSVEDDLRMALKEQSKGPTSGADIHRLPQTVKNQNLLVQERTHSLICAGK